MHKEYREITNVSDSTEKEKCIFSVDVEDWFHILELEGAPNITSWDSLPSRVVSNFRKILNILSEYEVQATCFFLGWVAERYPELVKEAHDLGHEIASHGYSHTLVYSLTPEEFLADIKKAKNILEDIIGESVQGYRAPGFSVTKDTPWFFDMLVEAGIKYDSSVFPAPRGHGGMKTTRFHPYLLNTEKGDLIEFPVTIANLFGKPVCFFGGGYLRLSPYFLINKMAKRVQLEGRPVIFYIHPREIDPSHPRMSMNLIRRFKSYVNLDKTQIKVEKILNEFSFTTFKDYISNMNLTRS